MSCPSCLDDACLSLSVPVVLFCSQVHISGHLHTVSQFWEYSSAALYLGAGEVHKCLLRLICQLCRRLDLVTSLPRTPSVATIVVNMDAKSIEKVKDYVFKVSEEEFERIFDQVVMRDNIFEDFGSLLYIKFDRIALQIICRIADASQVALVKERLSIRSDPSETSDGLLVLEPLGMLHIA